MSATAEGTVAGYGELKVFSARGRIGRMRYIAWCFAIGVIASVLAMAGGGLLGAVAGPLAMLFVGACYLAMMVAIVLATIQRCHDFNATGWLSLLLLVPLVPIVFWFIPGSEGDNAYGPPPPPNSAGVKVLFWLMIGFTVLGLLGSIAMPPSMMGEMHMPVQ